MCLAGDFAAVGLKLKNVFEVANLGFKFRSPFAGGICRRNGEETRQDDDGEQTDLLGVFHKYQG